ELGHRLARLLDDRFLPVLELPQEISAMLRAHEFFVVRGPVPLGQNDPVKSFEVFPAVEVDKSRRHYTLPAWAPRDVEPSYACHLLRPACRCSRRRLLVTFPSLRSGQATRPQPGPIDMDPRLNKRLPADSEEIANLLRIWRNVVVGRPPLLRRMTPAIGLSHADPAHQRRR